MLLIWLPLQHFCSWFQLLALSGSLPTLYHSNFVVFFPLAVAGGENELNVIGLEQNRSNCRDGGSVLHPPSLFLSVSPRPKDRKCKVNAMWLELFFEKKYVPLA